MASHVEAVVQFPVAIEINVPGTSEVNEMLSIDAGGCTPPVPSFFHEKINRKVVPAREGGKYTVVVCTPAIIAVFVT